LRNLTHRDSKYETVYDTFEKEGFGVGGAEGKRIRWEKNESGHHTVRDLQQVLKTMGTSSPQA
jgi:hypothetical protein